MLREGRIHISKYGPPPPELPVYQQLDPAGVSFIGRTNYEAPLESKKYIFGIKRGDRIRYAQSDLGIVVLHTAYFGGRRDVAVAYREDRDGVLLVTIHPLKPNQLENRIRLGRWKEST